MVRGVSTWRRTALAAWLVVACLTPAPSQADEGMWLFNELPRQYLKEKYGFEPSDAWLEHLMKSCVRFNSGGSASFVSADGLVLTNHHVGADTLHNCPRRSGTCTPTASMPPSLATSCLLRTWN